MSFEPLAGVRVLDLSRLYPGGLATAKLVALGADVVKVEEPGRGDYMRTIPPVVEGRGVLHWLCDRGKGSVELDVKTDEGRRRLDELLAVADVVVEAHRPGGLEAMGVDFADVRRAHPRLVLCSLTGFGQTGPLAGEPSHGMNMDSLAGVLFLEEFEGRAAIQTKGFSLGVELGAVNAALAIVAAVHHAQRTGEGTWIDLSCWDAAVDASRLPIASHLEAPEQKRVGKPPIYDLYEGSDGRIVLFCAIERKFWDRFCTEVGRPDLQARWSGTDVDFGTGDLRRDLEAVFAEHPAEHWAACFHEWGIPGSAVLSLPEVLDSPHAVARQVVAKDDGAPLVHVANPIRWHDRDERAGDGLAPAPALGADDIDDVLARWAGTAPI